MHFWEKLNSFLPADITFWRFAFFCRACFHIHYYTVQYAGAMNCGDFHSITFSGNLRQSRQVELQKSMRMSAGLRKIELSRKPKRTDYLTRRIPIAQTFLNRSRVPSKRTTLVHGAIHLECETCPSPAHTRPLCLRNVLVCSNAIIY